MNYIENIFVCLIAPLIIAQLCIHGKGRRIILFLTGGMTCCLMSSYISTFIASAYSAGALTASMTISPFVEEIIKLLPTLFYLLVFDPDKEDISVCTIMIAVGFATFENVCYLLQNGASHLLYLLIRGFGTGAMHVICGLIVYSGIIFLWDRLWLRVAGTFGLAAIAVTYHGIYNMLVSQSGVLAYIGYLIPVFTAISVLFIRRVIFIRK